MSSAGRKRSGRKALLAPIAAVFAATSFVLAAPARAVAPSDTLQLLTHNVPGFTNGTIVYSGILNEGPTGLDINPGPAVVTVGPGNTTTTSDFLLFSFAQATGTQTNFYYAVGLSSTDGSLSDVVVHARYNAPTDHNTYEYWGMLSDADAGPVYAADAAGVNNMLNAFFATHPNLGPGAGYPTVVVSGIFAETGTPLDLTTPLFSDYGQGQNYVGTQVLAFSDIEPVPEPGPYALLLAGLGLCGWAARRRK